MTMYFKDPLGLTISDFPSMDRKAVESLENSGWEKVSLKQFEVYNKERAELLASLVPPVEVVVDEQSSIITSTLGTLEKTGAPDVVTFGSRAATAAEVASVS